MSIEGETRAARVYAENLRVQRGEVPVGGETVHACPPDGEVLTPCCRRSPFELPWTDRLTEDPALVTCTPPVVGDQPEETDTVNDSLLDRHLASLAEQMTTRIDSLTSAIARHNADIDVKHQRNPYRIPFRDESRWLGDREHELRLHQEDLAAVTAMQAELAALATSPAVGAEVRVEWGVRYGNSDGVSPITESVARACIDNSPPVHQAVLVSRTVTTSAWQPVTDDRQEGQA